MKMPFAEKIDPKHTALVVIDMQRDFAAPDGLLARLGRDLSGVDEMIDTLQHTIAVARDAGVPVLYLKQLYDRNKLTALQQEQYDLDGKLVTCDIDTDGHEYYKITPDPEKLFVKYNFNAFSNPQFTEWLMAHGIKTLVITGMDTIYCVETAVRNAFDLGYKVVVPTDLVACNAKHAELHNRTLKLVKKVFGVVSSADELMKIWRA